MGENNGVCNDFIIMKHSLQSARGKTAYKTAYNETYILEKRN